MFQQQAISLDVHKTIVENNRREVKESDVIIQGLERLDSNDTGRFYYHLELIKSN